MARSKGAKAYEREGGQYHGPLSGMRATLKTVYGEGPRPARIMLIGERPGEREARYGRPFVGPAGDIFNTMLVAANLDRSQIYVTNLVKNFCEYDKPTMNDIAEWGPHLLQEILDVQPEVIGLLGAYAVKFVLEIPWDNSAEMDRIHGVPVPACIQGHDCVVIPMMHPAGGLYNPDSMNLVLDDFLRLGQYTDGEISCRTDEWLGRESYEDWTGPFYIRQDCAVDTEGSLEHPWCLTWSTAPGSGTLVKSVARGSEFAGHVWLHNSLHDLPVLRKMGAPLREGQYTDTMVLAYHLCIEPKGLKPLGYRHCGAHQEEYQDIVREANDTKAMDYLLTVSQFEWPDPDKYVVVENGIPKEKRLQNVSKRISRALLDLAKDKRDKDGNPVDLRKRWNNWEDEVKEPVVALLGDMPVATLDDVPYEQAKHYACRDADITLRVAPVLMKRVREMGLEEAVAVDHAIIPMIDRMQEVGVQLEGPAFWQGIRAQCEDQMHRARYQVWQMTGANINPASGDQVAELLYDQLGLVPPKMTDSGERGSVNALCLETLLGQAPVVQPIMDYNEANKIKGTYCDPLEKLCQIGDGRARSSMRLTNTTTGRMSLADPPLHQIPIMTELGRQLRAGFVAPDGRVLGDWDLDQIEMRIMAHESQDKELIRLFNEGRDIHSETTCKIFSVPMSALHVGPDGKVKDPRRTVAKHAGFGIINGITEHGLHNYLILNRCRRPDGEPWTLDDCVMLLQEWFKAYPGVEWFQQQCVAEAHETGLTRENISGRINYLPAVWSPIKRIRETAERVSYVHRIQGGAAALMKKIMANVWKEVCKLTGVDCLLWVHDELLMEIVDNPGDKIIVDALMTRIMSETIKLRVPVRASGGYAMNWLEAH